LMIFGCISRHRQQQAGAIKVAPIASCPPPRLVSKDAGAGEARYGDAVDMAYSTQFGAYIE